MYGLADHDWVVKYYDLAFGISGESEVAWYLGKVRETGGPVLDLACGTGRLALTFARAGFEVTAIDQSVGMLEQFRRKLDEEPPAVRGRVRIDLLSMSHFSLGSQFNTVVCCDAFFHNLTVEDQIKCLERVAMHLNPKGRFCFNLPNPTSEFILKSVESAGEVFEERGRYRLEDGSGSLLVEQSYAGNPSEQIISTTLRMHRLDPGGIVLEMRESEWHTRYLFKYEAVHLLSRCGFQVDALVGDYRDGPVVDGSQLIFVASLRKGINDESSDLSGFQT